ncbi:uncharacterized protein DEA37_0007214, partial [Paragonimus westermani]
MLAGRAVRSWRFRSTGFRLISSSAARYQLASKEPFLNGTSSNYIEDIYEAWLKNPASVHKSWDIFFRGVNAGAAPGEAYVTPPTLGQRFAFPTQVPIPTPVSTAIKPDIKMIEDHLAVQSIIRSYQVRGHLAADLDPLGITSPSDGTARYIVYKQYLGEG